MGAGRRLPPLIGALIGALAGCAAPVPPPSPVVATLQPGVTARSTSSVTIRTQVPGLGGPAEVAGIACTLQARAFRASFTTPATLTVPDLGARQPPADLTCTRDGATRSLRLEPVNLTRSAELQRRADGLRNDVGGLGMIAVALVSGLRQDRATDRWGYRDATLLLDGPR